ncbi:copper amine oxidase N-terminal domain-containing protein [Paenibacillus lutrae]|uniref:Copper amine oxidase-like N-terminal domain-containing protein n=1 Tax=Paenibacillus lutrae TaxID=2078573 RepID=A0A7X3FLK1_9BACL|nr:copper amine oxidase N-terminal domain-containing protein [Paenibacillus lutrae]MVP01857.1 hypothetical protein [Paenibacillus lutrae]
MYVSKKVFISSIVASSLLFGSVGVFAAGGIEKIQAYLNHGIKFQVNGASWVPKDSDGVKLAPVVYEGSSYLPARAVAEALGAEVKWDDDTQTIYIKSGSGSSNDGIPYKDGSGSSSGGNTSTPSNPGSGSVSVPTSGGAYKLPGNFDPDKTATDLKSQAVTLIKLYGEALKTSDVSKFNAYVDGNIADKNGDRYMPGRDYSKKLFKDELASAQKVNDAATIAKYATTLTSVSSSDVKVAFDPYKSDINASFSYSFFPEDWDAFSSIYVYLDFSMTDNGDYVLNGVSVH